METQNQLLLCYGSPCDVCVHYVDQEVVSDSSMLNPLWKIGISIPKTRQKQKGRRKEIPQAIANSVSRNIGCLNVAILWNAKTNTFAKRINQVNEPKLDQCLQISLRGVGY